MLQLNATTHRPDDSATTRAQGAERARGTGRELLAQLGAWPWAHVAAGKLASTWREEERFTMPLLAWHRRAVEEASSHLEDVRRVARVAFGQGRA